MKRIAILFFFFIVTCTIFAEDTVEISFVGPESIHVAYHADGHSDPVWLVEDYNGFKPIKQVTGSGTYRFEPSALEYYRFALCTNSANWKTLATSQAIFFRENKLYGYMLFDEVVDQVTPEIIPGPGPVVVPDGISLELQQCRFDNDWTAGAFIVSGAIEVTGKVTYSSRKNNKYYIYKPQTLENCVWGQFYFKDGSDGSSITGGTNAIIFTSANLAISDVNWADLTAGDGADVNIADSTFTYCALTGMPVTVNMENSKVGSQLLISSKEGSEATVTMKDSQIIGQCQILSNAVVNAENCTYQSILLTGNAQFTCKKGIVNYLSANLSGGSCTMTSTTNVIAVVGAMKSGTFTGCRFTGAASFSAAQSDSITFNDCLFFSTLYTHVVPAQFSDCDFGGLVTAHTPSSAKFNGCQFLHSLEILLSSTSANLPTIENNSFLYKEAIKITDDVSLTNVVVPIGANYYGDPKGPVQIPDSTNEELFKYRGGRITWEAGVQLAPPLKKGINRDVKDMPLHLWEIAKRYGQGTIPHGKVWDSDLSCLKGRETVYIVDVGVNRSKLDTVEFRATFDGKYISPTRGSALTVHRDYAHLSKLQQEAARNTVNFILPPTTATYQLVRVEYRLSPTQEFQYVSSDTLNFDDAYSRKLQLHIVPLKLHVYGYSGGAPNAGNFRKEFIKTMSAKTAIPAKDINIWYTRPYDYYGALGSLSLTYLLNDIALKLTSGRALIACCNYLSEMELTIDYTIALLDDGVLKANGVDGASLPLFRRVLFTDGDTDALLHEFGHAFGMYTSDEQYDLYPKFGLRVAGVSAFVTEPIILAGLMGDPRRLRQFPATKMYWYSEKNFFDIMGGTPKNSLGDFWPIHDTAKRFYSGLKNVLNASASQATTGPAAAGTRRIYVSAKTERKRGGSFSYTYLVPWSLDIMNITEFSGRTEPGPECHEYSGLKYQFEGFDSTGGCVYSEYFWSGADYAMEGGYYYGSLGDWYRTFDIPDSAVAYKLTQKYHYDTHTEEQVIWESSPVAAIETEITSPVPGATISNDFLLSWSGNGSANVMDESLVPPLRYMVWASLDGGTTWLPQSYMTAATEVNISYAQLPSESNIIFRVLSSDGFSTHSTTLSGLIIEPHTPLVTITEPLPNARGTTGTVWTVSADIYDPDGDETTNISWYSSLDGYLGTGPTITTAYLSSGTHAIECRAYDAGAHAGTADVTVHVTPGVDYALSADSLWLCSTDLGPYAGPCRSIHTGTPLAVCFQMQAPGVPSDIEARIQMTGPDSVTTTLATPAWSNVSAFAALYHEVEIMPEQWGTYSFSAELIGLSPADSVPGDTDCSIQCSTVTPPEVTAKRDTVDFGYQDVTVLSTTRTVQVYNSGGEALVFGRLSVGGMHPSSFTIADDSLSSVSLAAGATGTVSIVFDPMYIGCNQAYLALPCNDPRRSAYALNLKGDYLTPEPVGIAVIVGVCALLLRRR